VILATALFNYESGGFNKDSRRHEFGKLSAAFAHLTTAPALIVQCEGRSYAELGGEGLYGAAAALSETLGVRYVGLLGHLDRGPIAPAVFYDPETLTVRSWVGHDSHGVFDDWRNVGWFTVNATGGRLGVVAQHWDPTCGDRRLFEAKQVGRFGPHPDPVLLCGDLNASASGPLLPQRRWPAAAPMRRHHEGIVVGDEVVADTRALDYLIGAYHEDCGERHDGMGFDAVCEQAHTTGTPPEQAYAPTVNRDIDQGAVIKDWLLTNAALTPAYIPGTYRVHLPPDDPKERSSDHNLVTASFDL
jgi:hypothetical protein